MSDTMEITRYPNRRLYDRNQKKYVTIGDIEALVLSGHTIRVRDSKTDEDLTRATLVQILIERHPERLRLFPVPFLQAILRADQLALDWLTVYFGNAKPFMDGMAGAGGTPWFPGLDAWQALWSGSGARPTTTTSTAKSSSEANEATEETTRDLAAKVAALEARLRQLERGRSEE